MGTEFYIILEGEVSFYKRYTPEQLTEDVKNRMKAVEKESELRIQREDKRVKSNYAGVPRIQLNTRTSLKKTPSGFYVFYDGILWLKQAS